MRRYLSVAVFALAGCVSSSVAKMEDYVEAKQRPPRPMAERHRVAVVDFVDRSQYGKGQLGTSAADILQEFLVNSGQFRIYERRDIAKVLDEQKLGSTGIVDPATAAQVGKMLGVEFVAIGAVTNFGYTQQGTDVLLYQSKTQLAEAEVSVKLVDVATGEVIAQQGGRGYADTGTSGSLGLGGRMSFDERIAGRALRASIVKFIDKLIDSIP